MPRYSKPVWQMVKEAIETLGELNGPSAIQYVHDHYREDNVKEATIQAQLIACSVNHKSARYFDDPNRFLWYLGNGRYRAYDPEMDKANVEGWRIISVTKPVGKALVEEVPFSRVEPGNKVLLPPQVATTLGIAPNDIVVFVEDNGKYYVKKGRLKVEVE